MDEDELDKVQIEISKHIIQDDQNWISEGVPLVYVAGMDIRFLEHDMGPACVGLIIFDNSDPEIPIVYEQYRNVEITKEYQPGYLYIRYLNLYKSMLDELKKKHSQYCPQVIMLRAGGTLHHNRCGLASHLGIVCDIPTIGVQESLLLGPKLAKKMNMDLETGYNQLFCQTDHQAGEYSEIRDRDNILLGVALVCNEKSKRPTYVSVGHRVSLDTAIDLVLDLSETRIPEPIRQVRISCREKLLLKQDK